jgi:hypothetical protein
VLSYVGGPGCSDRRPAAKVRSPKRPWCGLERAVEAAPAGGTVLVRRGIYKRFDTSNGGARPLRLLAYPGERVVLRGAEISGSELRIERFRITGTIRLLSRTRRVALVGNRWFTDGRSGGTNLVIEAGAEGVLVEGNSIGQRGSVGVANAINFSSTDRLQPIRRVTIRDNRIGPITGGGDAIQAKNTRGLLVEGNEIFGVRRPPRSGAHTDAFQSIYGARGLVLRRNFIHDIKAQAVFLQNFRGANVGFRAEDNVIARVAGPWVELSCNAFSARLIHNTIGGLVRIGGSTRRAVVVANIAGALIYNAGAQTARDEANLAQRFKPRRGRRSILGSPRYRNARRNDFRLGQGSRGVGVAPGGSDVGSRWADWSNR